VTDRDLARLEAEARYHRERLSLYRARAYGSDTTTPARLRELEREAEFADSRLRAAREQGTSRQKEAAWEPR
jgi:hypothetical protein